MKSNHRNVLDIEIGKFLKDRRIKAGLTQAKVTSELGFSSAQHLSNIERGASPASIDILKRLAVMYSVKPTQMVSFLTRIHKSFFELEFLKKSSAS